MSTGRTERIFGGRSWVVVIVCLGVLPGCATSTTVRGGYCSPPATATFSFTPDPPVADDAPQEAHVAALVGLSGATPEQVSRSPDARIRVIERVELASLAIGATAAELDCESERAEQAADYLSRQRASTVQALTIGSVAAATLTGIVGVFLSTKGASALAQDATAISGGAVTAGLGLASLYVHPRTTFEHQRNLLADVWLGPTTSTTFPPVIWAYLTRPAFSNDRREAIRRRIVARWKQFQQVEDLATAATLFGTGGSYDVSSLRVRAAMLDEVKAEVELEKQDLASFAASLLR
jgi:hypothetical protein